MAAVEDQEPVETLRSDGADKALGKRVCLRRSHRRADRLDPFASDDGVELTRELAIAIADHKARRRRTLRQSPSELTGLLRDPGAARVGRAAGEMHPAAAELDEEENVQPPQGDGLDREESRRRACCAPAPVGTRAMSVPRALRQAPDPPAGGACVRWWPRLSGRARAARRRCAGTQRGFSRESRSTSSRIPPPIGGRPTRIRPALRNQPAVPPKQCRQRDNK